MQINKKWVIFSGLAALTLLGTGVSLAQINVKSDLWNAVQNIQNIYFSPDWTNKDPEKHVRVTIENGVITVYGRVILGSKSSNNAGREGMVFAGDKNVADAAKSVIIGGNSNKIQINATEGIILWGSEHQILSWSKNLIWWGVDWRIANARQSLILGGENTRIEWWNFNAILAGDKVRVVGDHNVAGGKNVKIENKNKVFARSDNKQRLGTTAFFNAERDNTFLIRAENGIGIGTNNPQVKGIDVNGFVKIGDEKVACTPDTAGTITFLDRGDEPGCFCFCNGGRWESLVATKNCRRECPKKDS